MKMISLFLALIALTTTLVMAAPNKNTSALLDAQNKGLNSSADAAKKQQDNTVHFANPTKTTPQNAQTPQQLRDDSPLNQCLGLQGAELKQCVKEVIDQLLPKKKMLPDTEQTPQNEARLSSDVMG